MDSIELTKFAGAALAALLLIFGPKTIATLSSKHNEAHSEAMGGYALKAPKAEATIEAAAVGVPAAGFDAAAVVKMLAAAKPENGEAVYKRCAACHVNTKAAKSGAAPSLWNLVGRKKGTREDFAAYSEAIKAKGGEWSFPDLAAFLHNSKEWLPGTKMNIAIADNGELADLLAYLRTLSDSPATLP